MTVCEADLMDGALVIAAGQMTAALAAVEQVLNAAPGAGRTALAELGFTVGDGPPADGLVVNAFRGVIEGPADATLGALAPYVDDGTTLVWEDDNGERWRYLIAAGQVIEQVPVQLWRDANDHTSRIGGVVAKLTVSRNPEAYAKWWAEQADTEAISEAVEQVAASASCEIEYALNSLCLEVFQADPRGAPWLRVDGLGRGVKVEYLTLDIDPARDGDGMLDGVDVVLSLHPQGSATAWLQVSVYVDRATRMFLPESCADPAAALAEIIDTALMLINNEIADRDRFTFSMRDVLT
jgi:hypothetical protein